MRLNSFSSPFFCTVRFSFTQQWRNGTSHFTAFYSSLHQKDQETWSTPTEFINPTASWWSTAGLIIANELCIILYTWNINPSHLQPALTPKREFTGEDKTLDPRHNSKSKGQTSVLEQLFWSPWGFREAFKGQGRSQALKPKYCWSTRLKLSVLVSETSIYAL